MSALLEKPVTRGRQETLPRAQISRKPAAKPQLHLRARIVQKNRTNYAAIIGTKCAILAGLMGLTYMASSFGGQVLLEGARQERIEAKRRAQDAKKAEEILTAKLRVIVSAGGVEEWALTHGFVAPEAQVKPEAKTRGLVASR